MISGVPSITEISCNKVRVHVCILLSISHWVVANWLLMYQTCFY